VKILEYRDSNSDLSVGLPVATCYTDCAIAATFPSVYVLPLMLAMKFQNYVKHKIFLTLSLAIRITQILLV
jgi:hypothetical protein